VAHVLGPYPAAGVVRALGGYDLLGHFAAGKLDGFVPLERSSGCGYAPFDRLGISDNDRLGGFPPFGLREILLSFSLVVILFSEFTLDYPDHLIFWISVGFFAFWILRGPEQELGEVPSELVDFCPLDLPAPWLLLLWRRHRAILGY
jgi:hypothetical protein